MILNFQYIQQTFDSDTISRSNSVLPFAIRRQFLEFVIFYSRINIRAYLHFLPCFQCPVSKDYQNCDLFLDDIQSGHFLAQITQKKTFFRKKIFFLRLIVCVFVQFRFLASLFSTNLLDKLCTFVRLSNIRVFGSYHFTFHVGRHLNT